MANKRKRGGRTTPKGTRPAGWRPGLGDMLRTAEELQTKLAANNAALDDVTVTGTAGGSAVEVTLDGHGAPVAVKLTEAAVDLDDLSFTEDLIAAALRDAHRKLTEVRAELETDATGGVDLADLDLDAFKGRI